MPSRSRSTASRRPADWRAGFASSLIGCLQTAGGSLVGYLIGALYNHTALPMALAVGVSAALAGITYFGFLVDRKPAPNLQGGS